MYKEWFSEPSLEVNCSRKSGFFNVFWTLNSLGINAEEQESTFWVFFLKMKEEFIFYFGNFWSSFYFFLGWWWWYNIVLFLKLFSKMLFFFDIAALCVLNLSSFLIAPGANSREAARFVLSGFHCEERGRRVPHGVCKKPNHFIYMCLWEGTLLSTLF